MFVYRDGIIIFRWSLNVDLAASLGEIPSIPRIYFFSASIVVVMHEYHMLVLHETDVKFGVPLIVVMAYEDNQTSHMLLPSQETVRGDANYADSHYQTSGQRILRRRQVYLLSHYYYCQITISTVYWNEYEIVLHARSLTNTLIDKASLDISGLITCELTSPFTNLNKFLTIIQAWTYYLEIQRIKCCKILTFSVNFASS